ncbi:MAG: hypothetical protein HUJ27_11810 [Rhodobacteraceae bacterium]|nr:hypothetical protein [Paracoccaceae bacterium]
MTPSEIIAIRAAQPEEREFVYFHDREVPWLLSNLMPAEATVPELRKGPGARLLERPLVKQVIAASGGRVLRQDIAATADPNKVQPLTRAGDAGVVAATKQVWLPYQITFDEWATEKPKRWAPHHQMSRPGGNLVLQVNFPVVQDRIFDSHLPERERENFEFSDHPVRTEGRPTMAWVRLDIDHDSGQALIEEVQSDWFRYVTMRRDEVSDDDPESRHLVNLERYEAQLRKGFGKNWARVALFAALRLLRDDLGIRTVFYHQPIAGRVLKRISDSGPPKSLYTDLPRRFAFQPTRFAPDFLLEHCVLTLGKLRSRPEPLFWRLDFEEAS